MLPKGHTQPWCCNTYGCLLSYGGSDGAMTKAGVKDLREALEDALQRGGQVPGS